MSESGTRKRMIETFIKLLAEKPAGKISIQELAASGGFQRQTFYYHFKNIEELAVETYQYLIVSQFGSPLEIKSLRSTLEEFCAFIKDNRLVIKRLEKVADSQLEAVCQNRTSPYRQGICLELLRTGADQNFCYLTTDFIFSALLSMINDWADGYIKMTAGQLAGYLDTIINASIYGIKALTPRSHRTAKTASLDDSRPIVYDTMWYEKRVARHMAGHPKCWEDRLGKQPPADGCLFRIMGRWLLADSRLFLFMQFRFRTIIC